MSGIFSFCKVNEIEFPNFLSALRGGKEGGGRWGKELSGGGAGFSGLGLTFKFQEWPQESA
jgi:hypothetical protein